MNKTNSHKSKKELAEKEKIEAVLLAVAAAVLMKKECQNTVGEYTIK
jgi:hypothetical protein